MIESPNMTEGDPWDKPVFVIGCTFRCGSTFLQRLINSSGQAFIWGENVGISEELSIMVRKLDSWEEISRNQAGDLAQLGTRAWIANLNPPTRQSGRAAARAFLTTLYEDATRQLGYARWGFKEVRGGARTAEFLLDLYPEARVILLVRRPEAVLASMATSAWYAHNGGAEGILEQWCEGATGFLALRHPGTCLLRLEDFARSPESTVGRLGSHLGIEPRHFDHGLLQQQVRGSTRPPSIDPELLGACNTPVIGRLVSALGYDEAGTSPGTVPGA